MKMGMGLKLMRIRCGLTLEDVAAKMACTKQTISNIERGKGSPMAIKFYEITISEIYAELFEKEDATET